MVWGMALPNGFGEFWPSGFFEKDPMTRDDGWYERLKSHYEKQSPEEQKRLFDFKGPPGLAGLHYGSFPSEKLTNEPGTKDSSGIRPAYGLVEDHEIPRSFDTEENYKTLGSLIKLNDKILAVDEPLKAVIERMEPGVHEFFPFELRMPGGKTYPGQYYVLRVCQYFDALSREDSLEGAVEDLPIYGTDQTLTVLRDKSKKTIAGLAFRQSVFGSAHLWRDRSFGKELTCFSDELIAEIEAGELRLPKHYKMKEV